MKRPKLRTPLLLSIAAVITWYAAWALPENYRPTMQIIVFLQLLAAAWGALDLLIFTWIDRRRLWIDANQAQHLAGIQEERRLAETLMQMSDDQLNAFGRHRVGIEIEPGTGGPIYTLVLPFARIPYDFVQTFLENGSMVSLAPIRRWSEGTKPRQYAEALTKYFIDDGYAGYEPGNHSAYWLSDKAKEAALKSLDYPAKGDQA